MIIQEEIFVDCPTSQYIESQKQIINLLHENNYSISEARGLFKSIIELLERSMPITNNII